MAGLVSGESKSKSIYLDRDDHQLLSTLSFSKFVYLE